jgi:hypothetical protein
VSALHRTPTDSKPSVSGKGPKWEADPLQEEQELRRQTHPSLPNVEKIEEAVRRGFKPRVFLEELDKIKPSEFAINQIFRIFDALDRHRGQLVIDTNLSKQEFMDIYGEPIARRVKENCRMKEYGFQGGTE